MENRPAPRRAAKKRNPLIYIIPILAVILIISLGYFLVQRSSDYIGSNEKNLSETRGILPDSTGQLKSAWTVKYSDLSDKLTQPPRFIDANQDKIIVVYNPAANGFIAGINSDTGEIIWKESKTNLASCTDAVTQSSIYCATGNKTEQIQISDGKVVKELDLIPSIKDIALHDNYLYAVGYELPLEGHGILAVFAKYDLSGKKEWQTEVQMGAKSAQPYLNYRFTDKYLFPGTTVEDGKPVILDIATGKTISEQVKGNAKVLGNGTVAVSGDDGVTMLNGAGNKLFQLAGAEQILASWDKPLNKIPYLFTTNTGSLPKLSGYSNQGRKIWELSGYSNSVAYCRDKVMAWNQDQDTLAGINHETGQIYWQTPLKSSKALPVYCAGDLAITTTAKEKTRFITAINLQDGKIIGEMKPEITNWEPFPTRQGLIIANNSELQLWKG